MTPEQLSKEYKAREKADSADFNAIIRDLAKEHGMSERAVATAVVFQIIAEARRELNNG